MTAVAAHGDELVAIVEGYGPKLRQLCERRLGPSHDIDDAVQEVLLRAWRALPEYDESQPLWPWLATIAGNVCIDLARRQRVDAMRRGQDSVIVLHDDRLEAQERDRVVREAMARLPNPSATALYLREVEGWDYEQIGEHLDRNAGAARTTVTRARHLLRTHVESIARSKGQWPLGLALGPLWAKARHPVEHLRTGRYHDIAQLLSLHAVEVTAAAAAIFGGAAMIAPTIDGGAPPAHEVAIDISVEDLGPARWGSRSPGDSSVELLTPTANGAGALGPGVTPPALDPSLSDGVEIHRDDTGLPPLPGSPRLAVRSPDLDDPSSIPDAIDLELGVEPPDPDATEPG